jgi:hypothetical protein
VGTARVKGEVLYSNPLAGPDDVADWVAEGPLKLAGGRGALQLSGFLDDEEFGDHAHWTFWCPVEFPDGVRISWEFLPLAEPGLAMVFFSASGHGGLDLFSPRLAPRTGHYPQYHSGDLDALHISYFRHKHAEERAFRTCNLRKSAGFELVAQAADPLPPAEDALDFYRMELVKYSPGRIREGRCWAEGTSGSGRWPRCGPDTGILLSRDSRGFISGCRGWR